MIADIQNSKTIIINRGSDDDVRINELYLVYRQGKEIIDPETKKSLGFLEVVLGKGKVIHVQDKIATLESANYSVTSQPTKTVVEEENALKLYFGGKSKKITYTEPEKKQQPFGDIKIGDLVKPI